MIKTISPNDPDPMRHLRQKMERADQRAHNYLKGTLTCPAFLQVLTSLQVPLHASDLNVLVKKWRISKHPIVTYEKSKPVLHYMIFLRKYVADFHNTLPNHQKIQHLDKVRKWKQKVDFFFRQCTSGHAGQLGSEVAYSSFQVADKMRNHGIMTGSLAHNGTT